MFTANDAYSLQGMIGRIESKLNMIGKHIDISSFYVMNERDKREKQNIRFIKSTFNEQLAVDLAKILGSTSQRTLYLDVHGIYGDLGSLSRGLNITKLVINSSKVRHITNRLLQTFIEDCAPNIKEVIFAGNCKHFGENIGGRNIHEFLGFSRSLERLYLPDGMTKLDNRYTCLLFELKTLSIPDSIEYIEGPLFINNTELKSVEYRTRNNETGKREIREYKIRNANIDWSSYKILDG